MRVAVSQFATTQNVQENLATCVAMINQIAVCKPSIIVLPEYCNTDFGNTLLDDNPLDEAKPSYLDPSQAWSETLSVGASFLQCIAEQAKKHQCYIAINVTLQRDIFRELSNKNQDSIINPTIKPAITVSTCLFSPQGELVHQHDKQTLTKYEHEFFSTAGKTASVVATALGKLGFLTSYDSMTFNASRHLALQGAQLLCNSTSSVSLDQSGLHNPARAFENNLFIATANKFGNSQIVSPEGKVLVKIDDNKAGFAFADIDLSANSTEIGLSNKCRPDGTPLIKQLRPELYQTLSQAINPACEVNTDIAYKDCNVSKGSNNVPDTANVAIFATYKSDEQAIEDVCHYIENNLSDIIQLPELFFIEDKTITHDEEQRAKIESLSKLMITQVSAVLRPFQYVCTSLVIEGMHQAVLISDHGVLAIQQQLHFCQRYQWTALGDNVNIIELPLEQGNINVAMLTADDVNIPEIVNIVALNGIHLLLVPFDIQEPCEVEYGLLSRAAENRICIVAASREKSFANDLTSTILNTNSNSNSKNNVQNKKKIKVQKSTGLIANLTQLKTTQLNSYFNQPLVKYQQGKITKSLVYPIAACVKLCR